MRVTIKYFTTLREITQRRGEEVELNSSIKVEDFIQLLSKKYGTGFRKYVYDEMDKVKSHFKIVINGSITGLSQSLKKTLEDGDEVSVIPPVGGG